MPTPPKFFPQLIFFERLVGNVNFEKTKVFRGVCLTGTTPSNSLGIGLHGAPLHFESIALILLSEICSCLLLN